MTGRAGSWSRRLALAAGAIAVVVLAGWALGIPVLSSFHAGYVTMKPNIAVSVLLSVAALLMLGRLEDRRSRFLFAACVAVVFMVSAATISEDVFGLDFGIDQILFRAPAVEPGTRIPGRPALGGMLCLFGASVSLGLLSVPRLAVAGQWAALVPLVLGYRGLIGYLVRTREFYGLGRFTDMALPGAIAFPLLAAALLLARADRGFMAVVSSSGAGGLLMRRLAPVAVVLLVVIGWLSQVGEDVGLYGGAYSTSLIILAGSVSLMAALYLSTRSLERSDRERTEAMLQLRNAMDRLRGVQDKLVEQARMRAMGEMASGIAHDLNNTLVPILGFTETLIEWPKTLANRREALDSLKAIRDAATDAADMVARLRRFYRPAGVEEAMGAHDLGRLVTDAVVLTRPKWRSRARTGGQVITVATEAGEVRPVVCNPDEVREVLVNLILNAVDAMPRGGSIVIRTREEGESCAVEVRDNGSGMTDEVKRRCFEPFFTTKGEGGTGLGLAMVASIVRRRGGSVGIESEPGRGTAVTVRLPIGREGGEPVKPVAAEPWKEPLRILVADDDPRVRRLLSSHLRRDRHRAKVTVDGLAALDQFKARKFDLVITDRVMPGMDGDELTDAIKRLNPAIPVIMVSGLESPESPHPGRAPADILLGKPFSVAELREAIQRAMRARQG